MEFTHDDHLAFPIQDFIAHSPFLAEIGWTERLIAALVRTGLMPTVGRDGASGCHLTTKSAIVQALQARDALRLAAPIDIAVAYRCISARPIV